MTTILDILDFINIYFDFNVLFRHHLVFFKLIFSPTLSNYIFSSSIPLLMDTILLENLKWTLNSLSAPTFSRPLVNNFSEMVSLPNSSFYFYFLVVLFSDMFIWIVALLYICLRRFLYLCVIHSLKDCPQFYRIKPLIIYKCTKAKWNMLYKKIFIPKYQIKLVEFIDIL